MSWTGLFVAVLIFGLFYYVSTIAESFSIGIPPFVTYPLAGYAQHLQIIGGLIAVITFIMMTRKRKTT